MPPRTLPRPPWRQRAARGTVLRETEATFQQAIVDLAHLCGWRVYHPFDARRSAPGFPDLVAVRRGRLVVAELKSATGRVRKDQRAWLHLLGEVPGVACYLWRPEDWEQIVNVLT